MGVNLRVKISKFPFANSTSLLPPEARTQDIPRADWRLSRRNRTSDGFLNDGRQTDIYLGPLTLPCEVFGHICTISLYSGGEDGYHYDKLHNKRLL
ncbi:hypothetical protein MHYP_G00240910 [Metynnis hypsauchen]